MLTGPFQQWRPLSPPSQSQVIPRARFPHSGEADNGTTTSQLITYLRGRLHCASTALLNSTDSG